MQIQTVSSKNIFSAPELSQQSNLALFKRRNKEISFGKIEKALNLSEHVYVAAECPPYWKVGGVATVMKDFKGLGSTTIIPYYNGQLKFDSETGEVTNAPVSVHKLQDGTPIMTNEDLNTKTIDDVIKQNKYRKLEELARKNMEWGFDKNDEIILYRVVPSEKEIADASKQGVKLYDDLVVFTDATAKMPKPYADGQYSYSPKPNLPDNSKLWQGNDYAKFDKATTEFLEDLNESGTIKNVVWNDSQAAYGPHYMSQKVLGNNKAFENMTTSYVEHNMGPGYTGSTSYRSMVVNMATTDQLKAINEDPAYLEALIKGDTDNYFKKMIVDTIDDWGNPNASMIPLRLRDKDFVVAATTVSEKYAEAAANNPMVAPELTSMLKKLNDQGKGGGILNPLNDPNLDPYKELPLPGYGKEQVINVDGVEKKFKPFSVFKPDMNYDQMKQIKNENKINLFERLSGKYNDYTVLGGLGKKVEILSNSYIDEKWIKKIEQGENVDLFVSWGRPDFQKGLDLVMDAFKQYTATTKGSENSVLVLGGAIPTNEFKNIKAQLDGIMKDPALKGRVCFMNGFAPGAVFASAADSSIFPSRFAPCELTDLESTKYFSSPIVTNTQGLAQKNFDPRIEAERAKATSYKTKNEFQMGMEKLREVSDEFNKEFTRLLDIEKKILEVRGVKAEKIAKQAEINLLQKREINDIYKEFSNSIITNELAEAMKAKLTETKETSELIYENIKKLKTGWKNNNDLHPSNKSTFDLYEELHFKPKSKKPEKTLFSFDDNIYTRVKNKTNKLSDKVVETFNSQIKQLDDKITAFINNPTVKAPEGAAKLSEGAAKLSEGTAKLAEGTGKVNKKFVAVAAATSAILIGTAHYLGRKKGQPNNFEYSNTKNSQNKKSIYA